MALIKPYLTPHAVEAKYHRIVKLETNFDEMSLNVTLAVYATKEARDQRSHVLWYEYVAIPLNALSVDLRDVLYPLLAEYGLSYLKGAEPDQPHGTPGVLTLHDWAKEPQPEAPANP